MNREAILPAVFAGLNGRVHYVRQVAKNEWSSSCPQCGGNPHKGGEFPDRFRMWERNRKGNPLGWCRRCGFTWSPDGEKPMSKADFEQWRREQIQIEEERKRSAERALALLQSEKMWMYFHEKLNDWSREVIRSWGISDKWAEHWRLGFVEDYVVHTPKDEYHSPAISIPLWQLGSPVPANIKLRTLNPREGSDRYRNWYKMGMTFPFVAFNKLQVDTCLVVEGEKKAMVCAEWSEQKYQVIGLSSKTPNPETLRVLDNYGRIYVCLDPDAKKVENGKSALERLVGMIGQERVLVVDLPDKVDDMIVKYGLKINSALRYATPWR